MNPDTGELYTPEDFNVITYEDEGVGMLQDAIWADGTQAANDAGLPGHRGQVRDRLAQGLGLLPRQRREACRTSCVAKGSKLGASHQLWQMNEINKLIWPSAGGVGMIDQAAWDRTVKIAQETKNLEGATVLTKAPDAGAYTNDIVSAAQAKLQADGCRRERRGLHPDHRHPQPRRRVTP